MTDRREDPQARATARRRWPIRKYRLGDEPEDDIRQVTTPAMRVALVWIITRDAWILSGRALPVYARHEMPGRVCRAGEQRPADGAA
jgi:hypothetical protein